LFRAGRGGGGGGEEEEGKSSSRISRLTSVLVQYNPPVPLQMRQTLKKEGL